jgi:Domain of unknown function (DUF4156)
MKKLIALVLLAIGLIAAGCSTGLTQQGSMIKIASHEEVKGYKYLGVVEGSSVLTGVAEDSGYRNALNEAMNKAAALGATHLVLDEKSEPHYWRTSEVVRGEAYRSIP